MSAPRDTTILPLEKRRRTAEEYFQMPEGPPYFQLVEGELIMSPSPRYYHQQIATRFAGLIYAYLRVHRIGEVTVAPSDVQLDRENVFQPDVYYVRKDRLGIIGEQGPEAAPDLVAEIISPSTKRLNLGSKKRIYAERGVVELWMIDPSTKEVHVYYLESSSEEPVHRVRIGEMLETPLLQGLQISVSEIFGDLG